MLKTISAALLAVSVLAAPALAASSSNATQTPAAKTTQMKPNAVNANAKLGHSSEHVRHHRSHKKVSALRTHQASKVTIKHAAPATKRG
jgi:hypothetical protein